MEKREQAHTLARLVGVALVIAAIGIEVASTFPAEENAAMGPIQQSAARVKRCDLLELTFDVPGDYENPFDPEQIAVDGHNGDAGTIILSLTLSVPSNDDFAHRILVTNFPATLSGSNIDATLEPDDPMGRRDVWWQWMAPISGPVTISTEGSSFDTILGIFTNAVLSQLGWVASNDNYTNGLYTSRVNIQAVAGTAYQIAVSGGVYDDGSGTIVLKIIPGAPPANDNFTNRIWLTGIRTNFTANNYGATCEPGEPNTGFYDVGNQTVWWSWQAPADGRVTLSTEGSDFDIQLAVYTGTSLTNLVRVARNIPFADGYANRVNFAVQANTTYNMAVDGNYYGREGTIQFALHFYHPFSISSGILARPSAGGFQFQGQGYPGAVYGMEVSTNLLDWELLPDLNLVGPSFGWRDTSAVNFNQRFYRLVEKTTAP